MTELSSPANGLLSPARPAAVPLSALWPWLLFVPLLLLAIYFVGAEEGATSLIKGMAVHEFVHDGRHLLGFPCH
jgi:hypothetical protein